MLKFIDEKNIQSFNERYFSLLRLLQRLLQRLRSLLLVPDHCGDVCDLDWPAIIRVIPSLLLLVLSLDTLHPFVGDRAGAGREDETSLCVVPVNLAHIPLHRVLATVVLLAELFVDNRYLNIQTQSALASY